MPWDGVEWRKTEEGLRAFYREKQVAWAPQPGSQVAFLTSPIFETLYEGTRGPGKTDALIMDFAQHTGLGYGQNWRGLLFRRTYKELRDVIDKSLAIFPRVFGNRATYNHSEHYWKWNTGEALYFDQFMRLSDYDKYHGHAYPWQGWEELTNWPDDRGFRKMQSCCRAPVKDMPRKVRATTNPFGVGHNWVKLRYRLPIAPGRVKGQVIRNSYDFEGQLEPERVAVHGELKENRVLLEADPGYVSRIRAAASSPAELRAWLYGDWNIVAGGMFDDLWDPRVHVLPNFPLNKVPEGWRLDRAYDHGQSAPFSVGWYAQSNGERFEWNGVLYGPVRGDIIRIAEWYGWNGRPNEGLRMQSRNIARGIKDREMDWGLRSKTSSRVRPGPADTSIFDDYEPQKSVAGDMSAEGVRWEKADKGPGSRVQGWTQIRKLLGGALPQKDSTRENPGLFVLERCEQFVRTVPVLPRDVEKDPDDVDTDAEDHVGDEVRYRVRRKQVEVSTGRYR